MRWNRLRSLAGQAVVYHWEADREENTLGVTSPAPTQTSPAPKRRERKGGGKLPFSLVTVIQCSHAGRARIRRLVAGMVPARSWLPGSWCRCGFWSAGRP
jgi:hypothetical protein